MIKSMTGFGRGEAYGCGKKFTIELKSVNHRFCEVIFKMPKYMISLEERCKQVVQEYVSRGRVEGFITVENYEERPVDVKVDEALADSYFRALKKLEENLQLEGKFSIQDIIQFQGVLVVEESQEDLEQLWTSMREALVQALENLFVMREVEGEKLYQDLNNRINSIINYNKEIEKRAPQVVEEYQQRLKNRLQEWLKETEIDEDRFNAEVVIFAERSNITEETVRMNSHLQQMAGCLDSTEPVGRKMDFLAQEINREINTIASKANDSTISGYAVEIKSELEKIREQIQNIE